MADFRRVAARFIQAGTTVRSLRGSGFTEKEALDNAMREDEREYGHGEGYGGGWGSSRGVEKSRMIRKPVLAKRVKIEKSTVRKGPVKKVFVIKRQWPWHPGDPKTGLDRDRAFTAQYEKQGDVLAAAKAVALKYQESLVIELAAFCEGNTVLARITPERSTPGIWEFTVAFRE